MPDTSFLYLISTASLLFGIGLIWMGRYAFSNDIGDPNIHNGTYFIIKMLLSEIIPHKVYKKGLAILRKGTALVFMLFGGFLVLCAVLFFPW